MQSETLKPCECGGDAQMRGSSDGEVEWYQCCRCAYESPPHYDRVKALAAWNTRTTKVSYQNATDLPSDNTLPTPPAESAGLVERLVRKAKLAPVFGGGSVGFDNNGRPNGSRYYTRDDGMRLVNPDGPEAAHHIAAQDAEIARKDAALERCAKIVEQNLYHQHEKIEDVPRLLRSALNPETGHD